MAQVIITINNCFFYLLYRFNPQSIALFNINFKFCEQWKDIHFVTFWWEKVWVKLLNLFCSLITQGTFNKSVLPTEKMLKKFRIDHVASYGCYFWCITFAQINSTRISFWCLMHYTMYIILYYVVGFLTLLGIVKIKTIINILPNIFT